MFLPEDSAAAVALALEEADACRLCGQPRAWCRDNENGRARFDVDEQFCWATYRVALRKIKQDKENVGDALRQAYIHTPKYAEGKEPDIMAGLEPVGSDHG